MEVISKIEDFAFLIPHENDRVSLKCPNGAPGKVINNIYKKIRAMKFNPLQTCGNIKS